MTLRCVLCFRFRQGFKQFFSFVPCINVRTGSLIRREVVTSRYSYSGSPDAHYRIVRNGNRKPGSRCNAQCVCFVRVQQRARGVCFPFTLFLPMMFKVFEGRPEIERYAKPSTVEIYSSIRVLYLIWLTYVTHITKVNPLSSLHFARLDYNVVNRLSILVG